MIINWLKVGMVAAGVAAILYAAHLIREEGAEDERAKIQKENQDAGNNAEKRRSKLHMCIESGGMYDFYTGKCSGAKTSLRLLPSWIYGTQPPGPELDR
ncbi:hypothetical protein [Rhizobium phage RHph_X2_28B]|uniref:hypothetical protein n=1 Tax=Rhizobium phage RHph_X2_28B TaxID=2836086 RepID=UPI00232966C5|nr:hypothetical protein PP751_gp081 [Rhizobium phage RHph_X2_28B]QWY83533.1 hypothetical protein [Rhizobium phage RHph_X2_28B]QWY83769.1 hypothetical protein [Rhizobium phage RHph_X3_15]